MPSLFDMFDEQRRELPERWLNPGSIEYLVARNLDARGVAWALNVDMRLVYAALKIRQAQLSAGE